MIKNSGLFDKKPMKTGPENGSEYFIFFRMEKAIFAIKGFKARCRVNFGVLPAGRIIFYRF
jgi:hypothetical protein